MNLELNVLINVNAGLLFFFLQTADIRYAFVQYDMVEECFYFVQS